MEWGEALKLAAAAGVLAAFVNQGLTWLREGVTFSWKKKANATYLAIRVAVGLEAFGEACAEVVSDITNHQSSGGNVGNPTRKLPQIGPYPADDESWRALDLTLGEQALTLPNKISAAQRGIDFINELGVEVYEDDEASEACLRHACQFGIEAFGIAARLRLKYGFAQYSPGHDHCDSFRDALKKSDEYRRKQEERNARMMEEMNAALEKAKAASAQAVTAGSIAT